MNTQNELFTPDLLRAIARYEATFEPVEKPFSFTLEDLYCTLVNLKLNDPSIKDFCENWFDPINRLSEYFDLEHSPKDLDDDELDPLDYPGLTISDDDQFWQIWNIFWAICNEPNKERLVSDYLDYDITLSNLEIHFANKNKPIDQRDFTPYEQLSYISNFKDDCFLEEANETQLLLARKMINQLCAEDCIVALDLKGYACYGGNRLFPCNWETSRDCMHRLYENTGNPQYANTLGYLYYYGRCNDGIPEYDKAYKYFTISALNGYFEGQYKLADLLYHGWGCDPNPQTANMLYRMVYDRCLNDFLNGKDSKFADAALRMCHIYANGIGEEPCPETAWRYLLEAEYAINLRLKHAHHYGDTTVSENIQKMKHHLLLLLNDHFFKTYVEDFFPQLFLDLSCDNYPCQLTREMTQDDMLSLTVKRLPTRSVPEPEMILVNLPTLPYCARTLAVSYQIDADETVWFKDDADTVRFDFCMWCEEDCLFEFYLDDQLVAYIESDSFFFNTDGLDIPPIKKNNERQYYMASVNFKANGCAYEYFCDDPSVRIGDTVIVEGYDGYTRAKVLKLYVKNESELTLPLERYKSVVCRADESEVQL